MLIPSFSKPRIAFIKYGGLAAGGTERLLQEIAIEITRLGAIVEYFYCEPKQSPGSSWVHPPNDESRRKHLEDNGIKITKFEIGYKDLSKPDHPWISSNFFEVFQKENFDLAWTAKAGPKEYPFYKLGIPFVETITLDAGFDSSPNRIHSIHISNWQRSNWIRKGGNKETSSLLPIPVPDPIDVGDLREELEIGKKEIVIGFHQRVDNAIASKLPFEALKALDQKNIRFLIMGGGYRYKEFARDLNIDCKFVDHDSSWIAISRFLRTLDIYAHGRSDGETFGTVLAEAMNYGIPIITHRSIHGANAHAETVGAGGLFAYNVKEYSRAIGQLATNTETRERYGKLGLQIARQQYSQQTFKQRVSDLYELVQRYIGFKVNHTRLWATPKEPEVLPGTRVMLNGFSTEVIGPKLEIAGVISNFFCFFERYFSGACFEIAASGVFPILASMEITRGQIGLTPKPLNKDFTSTEAALLKANGFQILETNHPEMDHPFQALIIRFNKGSFLGFCDAQFAEGMKVDRRFEYWKIPLFIGQEKLNNSWVFIYAGTGIQQFQVFFQAVHFSFQLQVKKAKGRYRNSRTGRRLHHIRFLIEKGIGTR